jgi:hypothetical protein
MKPRGHYTYYSQRDKKHRFEHYMLTCIYAHDNI